MFRESLSFLQSDSATTLLLLEALLWMALLGSAFWLARFKRGARVHWWRGLAKRHSAANRERTAIFFTGAAAVLLRLALLPVMPVPTPTIHDEFSYLLGADTFAHGRLTNPPHPLATHFESVHINVRPTYQSMYPPAQSMVMAAGQVLFGSPWMGVLLSVAALCMAVTWMLQGWMPARWALLGGAFCVLRFATFSYTVNTYMGGAVAGTGGALVLGAAGRMRRGCDASQAMLMALGLGILANSRPFEGAMLALPAVGCVLWRLRDKGWSGLRVILPGVLLMGAIGGWMLYYNWRGTGHPLLMPYQSNWEQYHITRPFIWQAARAIPHYAHASLRWVYVLWEYPVYLQTRTAAGLWDWTMQKLALYHRFYLFPMLPAFVFGATHALRKRQLRLLGVTLIWFAAGLLVVAWRPQPHYAAPAISLVIALMLYGLRVLRARMRAPVAGVAAVMVTGMILWQLGTRVMQPYDLVYQYRMELERPRVLHQLEAMGGKHVVLVHYVVGHDPNEEWVYNSADIDGQQVIWARDMGGAANAELLRYYAGRTVWMLQPDEGVSPGAQHFPGGSE